MSHLVADLEQVKASADAIGNTVARITEELDNEIKFLRRSETLTPVQIQACADRLTVIRGMIGPRIRETAAT